jgi:hypothetical protein
MPSSKLHGYIVGKIHDIISEQLRNFEECSRTRTAKISNNLYPLGSAIIKFPKSTLGKDRYKKPR